MQRRLARARRHWLRSPARSRPRRRSRAPPAAPTLVVDNSFALDTTDPQRAFELHVDDRRPRGLRHAVHLQGQRPRASGSAARPVLDERRRQDVHLSAQAERPLRRRHAADCGRRRLLVQAARQPEGQSLVPPVRVRGVGERDSTRSSSRSSTRRAAARRSSPTRRPASSTRSSSGRTAAPMPPTPPRPTRPSPGSTRPPPPEPAAGRTRSIRTPLPRRSSCARTRTTGARGSPRSAVS